MFSTTAVKKDFVSFITPQHFCCENWWFILNKTYEISRSLINNNHILRSFRNLFSLLCFKSCFSKFQIRTFYCASFCLFVLRLRDDKSTRTTIMTWLWRMQQLNFLFNIFSKKASALGFVQGPRHIIFSRWCRAADFGYTCNSVLCLRKPCIFALLTVMHQSISSEALFATSRELTSSPLLQNSTFSSPHCPKTENYVQKLFHGISPNSHVSKLTSPTIIS